MAWQQAFAVPAGEDANAGRRGRALTSTPESGIMWSNRQTNHCRFPTHQDLTVKAVLAGVSPQPTCLHKARSPSVPPDGSVLDGTSTGPPRANADPHFLPSLAQPQSLEILPLAQTHRSFTAQPEQFESLLVAQFLVLDAPRARPPMGAPALQSCHPTGERPGRDAVFQRGDGGER